MATTLTAREKEGELERLLDEIDEQLTLPNENCILLIGASHGERLRLVERIAKRRQYSIQIVRMRRLTSQRFSRTRGNMREVFDRAVGGATVLLFDGLEALFEQRDQDGEENLLQRELAYLCQRSDSFAGITILTLDDTAYADRPELQDVAQVRIRLDA